MEVEEAEEAEAEAAGYRIKNKNPTQRCGEKQKHLLPSRNLTDDHEKNTIVIAVKLNALDLVHVHMKAEFCHPYIKLNAWDEESA